jgi:hypothetical protein
MKWTLYPCETSDVTWYVIRGERPMSPRTKTMAVRSRFGRVFRCVRVRKKRIVGMVMISGIVGARIMCDHGEEVYSLWKGS